MATKRLRSPSLTDDAPPAKRADSEANGTDSGDQQFQSSVNSTSAASTAVHNVLDITGTSASIAEHYASAERHAGSQREAGAEVLVDGVESTPAVTMGLMVVAPEFQAVHDSWETFEEALKAYAKVTYQLYVIRSTTSVKRRNLKIAESAARGDSSAPASVRKAGVELGVAMEHGIDVGDHVVERTLIPERYQWYSKSLKCTHGWKDRHRGTGKRGSGVVRSTSCPAKMCVTLQHRGAGPEDWKVVLTKHVRTHNHQLSKALFLYYTENRRIYDPELLAVVGDAPDAASGAMKPSMDAAGIHLASLIDQANQQRSGLFRILTPSDEQSQQQLSSTAFLMSDSSATSSTIPKENAPDGRSSRQLMALSEASSSNFMIRPRIKAGAPPLGAMVLTAGTVPSRPMAGGGFCVPRVSVKIHSSWDTFHDYIAQYSFDTAQVFRTRSTVSVSARNSKLLSSAAAKDGDDGHGVASYASFAALSPTSRLIPEEYKWFSKLLICTYGWKRRARTKGSRSGEHGEGGPCPAMLLARVERNVEGQWHVVVNRQVPEHNHRLNGYVEDAGVNNQDGTDDLTENLTAVSSLESAAAQSSPSPDSSGLLEAEGVTTETTVKEPPLPSSAKRDIVVRVPKLQSVFSSWDDFHATLKAYSDATYQLYRTRTTSSVQGRNKKITEMRRGKDGENSDNGSDPETRLNGVNSPRKIPESWRWYSKTLTCTHGWKERHRGTGKRTAHVVRSTACPVKICATVQYMNPSASLVSVTSSVKNSDASDKCWRVVVTKHIVDHNHNLSRELYQHYCENRRIYDPELLAIDAAKEGVVVKQNRAPDQDTEASGISIQGVQSDADHITCQPPMLSTHMEAGLAEAVTHAQLFASPDGNHVVGIGASGAAALQRPVAGMTTTTGVAQQVVPSVVLLPYSTTASYLPGQVQSQAHQPPQQQTQQPTPVQAVYADNSSRDHLPRDSAVSEGVATLASVAAPSASPANIVLLNHAGMTGTFPSGSNVISVACRIHGSSTGTSSADSGSGQTAGSATSGTQGVDSANGQTTQCTCFRIAGGGNYVTIVPASEPLPANDNSFDADDESMLYAEDMEGVWQPSSNVAVEQITTESGETTWRAPRIVRRYPTWEAFHKYLDAYSAATFQLYRVRTTYSVRSRNQRLRQLAASRGLIVREGENGDDSVPTEMEQENVHGLSRAHLVPEHYEWYSKTFLCTHGWKRRSRGSGQRISHNVRATECPAKVCATLQRSPDGGSKWSVVVTKHLMEHNHEISEAIYQQYSEVRRVRDPEVLAQAEQLWRSGATRRRVFEFLKERSPNRIILMKDVHNLVQRWQAQERRPRQNQQQEEEEKENTNQEDEQQPRQTSPSAVSVSHDDENAPWL
ncbi:unnamed protein product [Phytophthora lilii]|uniref:Unnamed protein product n=1 Tax=Phytophthora lilii TaxID=2077276 RepID=A0A9W6TIZ4_9STRA|nr:unnamed protein product [Phytophthora lilii]